MRKRRFRGVGIGMAGCGALMTAISFFVNELYWFLMIGTVFVLFGIVLFSSAKAGSRLKCYNLSRKSNFSGRCQVSIHIGAKQGQIAPTILLPGDPLRAKHIAETMLEEVTLFNEVRGMLGYTGILQCLPWVLRWGFGGDRRYRRGRISRFAIGKG